MSPARGKAWGKKDTVPPSSSYSLTSLSLECLHLKPRRGNQVTGEAHHLTVPFRPTVSGRETTRYGAKMRGSPPQNRKVGKVLE